MNRNVMCMQRKKMLMALAALFVPVGMAVAQSPSLPSEGRHGVENLQKSNETTGKLPDKKEKNMAKTINEAQDEVIEEFSGFDDWMDKYQMLIDLGNDLDTLDEKYKTEQNLIDGCQSRVWLQCDYREGKLVFTADSDALIVKGIIALLIQVLSGHTPSEILNADLYFIDQIGLREHLSPTRSNGLLAMVKQIKAYALAYKAKEDEGKR